MQMISFSAHSDKASASSDDYNEEIVQPVSHTQIALESCSMDGNTGRRAGSQQHPITISRENKHVTLMALMDHVDTSGASSQELGSFARQHQDGRIRVWRHRGERILAACIYHRYTGPSPGGRLWDAIGYTSWSSLVHIDDTLNSVRYISGVFRPLTLPFIRALRNSAFQQDNARPHVVGIVRTFLDTENVRLSSWSVR
ncbi:uncharacterized protein TNCV_783321 [Trichonephila clavipes]|nr:uncharacterized protein TNCV_783321 [Trichonephila clavipes]